MLFCYNTMCWQMITLKGGLMKDTCIHVAEDLSLAPFCQINEILTQISQLTCIIHFYEGLVLSTWQHLSLWLQEFVTFCFNHSDHCICLINPLTPVPPVTALDEPWPFFLFWRHQFWPKLASSILNFCRRKRSFQWCPDQSDWPNGALDMHKNAQKRWVKNSEQNFLPLHLDAPC